VCPNEHISEEFAEKTGLSEQLSKWVAQPAARFLAKHVQAGALVVDSHRRENVYPGCDNVV